MVKDQIALDKIIIYDPDKIEAKNSLYTIFGDADHVGQQKVDVIKNELSFVLDINDKKVVIEAIAEKCDPVKILTDASIRNTIFVSGVDGTIFRQNIYDNSKLYKDFKNRNFYWIDMRSVGAHYIVIRRPNNDTEYADLEPYFRGKVVENGSCQLAADLQNRQIQLGNFMAAATGLQYILNAYRGLENEQLVTDINLTGINGGN